MVCILHVPKIWGGRGGFKEILMMLVSFDAVFFLLLRLMCLKSTVLKKTFKYVSNGYLLKKYFFLKNDNIII